MSLQLQHKRGLQASIPALANGELYFATDTGVLFVGNSGNVAVKANIAGTVTVTESQVTGLVSDLAAKAPLASPTLTGSPIAPTATHGTNTTQIATTAFVQDAVTGVGGGSPGGTSGQIQYNSAGSFGGVSMLSPSGTMLPNLVFRSIYKNVTATGNTDLYTCPVGKRAIACEITVFNNSGGGITTFFTTVKIGGVYYQTTSAGSIAGNNLQGSKSSHYILEAGETIAVNVTSQPCNAWGGVFEFDNTSNLKSSKLTTFAIGDNTVYTVPGGKSAYVFPNTFLPCSGTAGTFSYGNLSGGNRAITFNLVPSGGTPGATNAIAINAAVASPNTSFNPTITGLSMAAGDFFSVNTDAATAAQFAFVTVVEI